MRTIAVGETNTEKLKAYFNLLELDGITPALNEAGGQPEISINGNTYNATGIGPLISTGFGSYYALYDSSVITTEGDVILTRYKSGSVIQYQAENILVSETLVNTAYNTTVQANNSYATVNEANAFFANRLKANIWSDASYEDRRKALIEATQRIERLNFVGEKVDSLQKLQFPRKNVFVVSSTETVTTQDTLIPADIKIASYLIAYKLLDEVETDVEVDNLAMVSGGYHQAKAQYDRSFVQEHIRNGIPSFEAWTYLKPYLVNPNTIQLVRC